ncbi:UNVERIFIED_CONTAM: hypothetical protein Scaly_0944500 [Sesamum calycinum]|uniref:Pentatricopeptide repeat-containing protein n=1 Tax=Sesamum calycinum TaxID=2727403 RepID=A0AAW2QYI9_9LAMI
MPISISITRYSSFLIALKTPDCSLKRFLLFSTCSSVAAEKFLTHLQKDESNVEKNLDAVSAKLDSRCIAQVLERCAIDKPKLGVRFFIWAALHPTYRHTSYMYEKACKLLDVERNPQVITDVIDEYRVEGFVVSVKMFKVVLNLCRAAKDANLGLWVLRKMKEFNCRPDTVSYNVGFCDAGRLEDAVGLVKVMKGHGCVPNAVVYSTLLDGMCKHGSLETALEFLGGAMEALKVLDRMDSSGIKPNTVTFVAILDGFCKEGHLEEAYKLINKFSGDELQYDELYSMLVMSLLRAGKHKESEKTFRMMLARGMRPSGLASSRIIKRIISEGRVLDDFFLLMHSKSRENCQPLILMFTQFCWLNYVKKTISQKQQSLFI